MYQHLPQTHPNVGVYVYIYIPAPWSIWKYNCEDLPFAVGWGLGPQVDWKILEFKGYKFFDDSILPCHM